MPDIIKLSYLEQVCRALFCLVFVPKESRDESATKDVCVHELAQKAEAAPGIKPTEGRYTLVFK